MMHKALILAAAAMSFPAFAAAPPPHPQSGWAVVNSDGSLARGSNTTGVIHIDPGIYEVDFSSSVKKCVFTGTIGLAGSSGENTAGFVTVAGRGGNANGVYVRTFDGSGDNADRGFHLNVRC